MNGIGNRENRGKNSNLRPIETRYKGYRFRSRLEARWAVFFDMLGLPWEYETEGFELKSGRYLPDFKVEYPGSHKDDKHFVWFECKSHLENIEYDEWARMLEFEENEGLIILDGIPDLKMYYSPSRYMGLTEDQGENRFGWALWCDKGRLWWDEQKFFFGVESGFEDSARTLAFAVRMSRAARFEFGESGAPQYV